MRTKLCFPFVGNLVGGSHISVAALIGNLDRTRFDVLVLLQHGKGPIAEYLRSEGIPFETAPTTAELDHGRPVKAASIAQLIAAAPRLAGLLRRRGVDIVHCNDGRTLATWALPAKLARTKLLWHHRGSPRAAGLRLLAPVLADKVIAVSHFAAPRPGLYSAASRTHVIHSPFDTQVTHDRAAARAAISAVVPDVSPATRMVAFSGAMIDRKRPLLFVEAIAAMRRIAPHTDIRGVLLGETLDGMRERICALAEQLGIGDRLHFLGYRTPGSFWLAGCDLLMVPAVDEPFGRTLIEAMLVGTPVVATASGGNREAIRDGETGLLVPPERPIALSKACISLLSDPARWSEIAAAASADCQRLFGDEKHATAVMDVYAGMLTRRPKVREHRSVESAVLPLSLDDR